MSVPLHVQRPEVLERRGRRAGVELALAHVAPEGLGDLDVREMGRVEARLGVGDARSDRASQARAQQELDESRGVQHDHRESRSARITSAALRGAADGSRPEPLEDLLARGLVEGLADLAQDVVRHRQALDRGPGLEPPVQLGGTCARRGGGRPAPAPARARAASCARRRRASRGPPGEVLDLRLPQGARHRRPVLRGEGRERPAVRVAAERHPVLDRDAVRRLVLRGHEGHALREARARPARERAAFEEDLAPRGREEARERPHERRLAGRVRPDEGEALARLQREVHAPQHVPAAAVDGEPAGLEDGAHPRPSCPRSARRK